MRIHRLEVEAFGPFADRVVVDLDAASAGGLFLVHGPTGAGKTSLLDAVCFALYAGVPGNRSRGSLRSDHAAPDAAPEVVLELTVAGRRLKVTRSPEWYRPKRRGAGTTRVQPSVVLEEYRGGRWHAVSTRHDEVGEVVLDLLGMGLQQFSTVVLLPQGQFATFLRAEPDARRALLERLFDVGLYSDVEAWLAETRRTGAAELDAARSVLDADLRRLDDALEPLATADPASVSGDGSAPPAHPDGVGGVADLPGRLAASRADLEDRLTSSLAGLDAAETAETAAQQALTEARALAVLRTRAETATARLSELDSTAPQHDENTARLASAERAAGLRGHLAALERLDREVAELEDAVEDRRRGLLAAGVSLADGTDVGALADRAAALDAAASDAARHARRARELTASLEDAAERQASLRTEQERLVVAVPAARAAAADISAALTRLSVQGSRSADLRATRVEHAKRLALLDENDADHAVLAGLAPELAAARDTLAARQKALIALQQRRLDEMAGELAARLGEGDPCPVCGATEHPALASSSDPVTPEHLAAAEDEVAVARDAVGRLESRVGAHEAAVRTRLEVLDGADRPEVEADLADTERLIEQAREAERLVAEARAEQTRSRAEADRLAAALEQASTALAGLEERVVELAAEADDVRQRLAADLDAHAECPCGGTDPAHHATVRRLLTALASAQEACEAARDRRVDARTDLEHAVADAGFADVAAARAALLTTPALDRLRDAVLAHERDRLAALATLEDPDVRAALAAPEPDLEALRQAHSAARRAVLDGSSAHEAVVRAARSLERLRPVLLEHVALVTGLSERHARVRELADVVGGTGADNTLRMRLSAFVLAARLEKVAELANERLLVMGAGRYRLEHSDDRAARGAKSGLGLKVRDEWTGRLRDTATLSGGEAFMASLALALGLADAVREEVGGLDLGTLFVDEGFGSLDEDSLEQVVTVLDGLRDGGRAVGVVSHVGDLRSRITHQVVVTKGVSGSAVSVRTGADAAAARAS